MATRSRSRSSSRGRRGSGISRATRGRSGTSFSSGSRRGTSLALERLREENRLLRQQNRLLQKTGTGTGTSRTISRTSSGASTGGPSPPSEGKRSTGPSTFSQIAEVPPSQLWYAKFRVCPKGAPSKGPEEEVYVPGMYVVLILDRNPEQMDPLQYGDLIARWRAAIGDTIQEQFAVEPRWFAPTGTGDYRGPGNPNEWFVEE